MCIWKDLIQERLDPAKNPAPGGLWKYPCLFLFVLDIQYIVYKIDAFHGVDLRLEFVSHTVFFISIQFFQINTDSTRNNIAFNPSPSLCGVSEHYIKLIVYFCG